MLSEKMKNALDEQINKEIYSGYFYLGMSAYAASIGLQGFANWFRVQWEEELEHALKMFDYVSSQGSRVNLKPIEAPPQDFTSGTDLFEKTLAHEKKVTGLINDLVKLANEEKDQNTIEFLQWFVKEQVEEEENATNVLKSIENSGKDEKSVDSKLGQRK